MIKNSNGLIFILAKDVVEFVWSRPCVIRDVKPLTLPLYNYLIYGLRLLVPYQ